MLTDERRAHLLSRLRAEGRLVATDLAAELGTSEDTIRRDLRDLAAAGLLIRVHGGALPASPTHRPLSDRQGMQMAAKARLARAAAGLIRPGMIVLVDGGTTHLALVAALPCDLSATIVTHSPGIAAALEPFAQIDVLLLGGRLFRHSMVALGQSTREGLERVTADLCLLGVTGLSAETGLTTGDPEEARFKAAMMARAAEVAVLATSDKIGAASPWQVAPLSGLTLLVSEGAPPGWLPGGVRHITA